MRTTSEQPHRVVHPPPLPVPVASHRLDIPPPPARVFMVKDVIYRLETSLSRGRYVPLTLALDV